MKLLQKEELMGMAMAEADRATSEGNSPFGAVLCNGEGNVVAMAHNTTVIDTDPTAHAEVNVIRMAAKKFQSKKLAGLTLVSNAQSCPMCFCAAVRSGIVDFMYGYAENETLVPKMDVFSLAKFCTILPNIETGILGEECERQIREARERNRKKIDS